MATLEGQLDIELVHGAAGVSHAAIRSGRPLQASRMLEGLSPEKALHRLPMVFSLCGTAQSVAAVAACEEALSITPSPAQRQARAMLMWMESAREHLLRILLDWPGFADESVARDGLPTVMRLMPTMTRALFRDATPFQLGSVLNVDVKETKEIIAKLRAMIDRLLNGALPTSRGVFRDWLVQGKTMPARLFCHLCTKGWDQLGHTETVFLPPLESSMLHEHLAADEAERFISQPEWQGTPCETTPLQRQQNHPLVKDLLKHDGNGLLTRLTARLVELATIPDLLHAGLTALTSADMSNSGKTSDSGIGLAQVEASRGLLVHRVEIDKRVIKRYQILAPTEWNFHPRGIAAQGLRTLNGADEEELKQQATLWINAIDPCVGINLQVLHDA
jgi:uptake hydrogenase large subunit